MKVEKLKINLIWYSSHILLPFLAVFYVSFPDMPWYMARFLSVMFLIFAVFCDLIGAKDAIAKKLTKSP